VLCLPFAAVPHVSRAARAGRPRTYRQSRTARV